MTDYFTSDLHLGHANIIAYCQRPFASVEEMDATLIARWNARVTPKDTVYLIGDVAMGPREALAGYRKALQGRIFLVRGNHDRSETAMEAAGFDVVGDAVLGEFDGRQLVLRHKPDLTDEWKKGGVALHLCGHVHRAWARRGDIINVGVDVRDFEPKTLAELLEAAP